MAKITKKYEFKNANISVENGKLTITEFAKDGSSMDYNLSEIIGEFTDKDGVSFSIGLETEPETLN